MHERGRLSQRLDDPRLADALEPRGFAREAPDPALRQSAPGLSPALAALERAGLPPGPLWAAQSDAERNGVGPFDALATSGAYEEEDLVATLARALGVDLAVQENYGGPPIDIETYGEAMRKGLLFCVGTDGSAFVLAAARGATVEQLAVLRRGRPRDHRLALTTPRVFADVATARAADALAKHAAEGPSKQFPDLTVAFGLPKIGPLRRAALAAVLAAALGAVVAFELVAVMALCAAGLLFMTLNAFRLCLLIPPLKAQRRLRPISDADLPIYTVLVALYREAAVIPGLLAALERIDYPALGIKRTNAKTLAIELP